jgi:hypothetical protein
MPSLSPVETRALDLARLPSRTTSPLLRTTSLAFGSPSCRGARFVEREGYVAVQTGTGQLMLTRRSNSSAPLAEGRNRVR